jgi:hypothetical protein
MSTNRKIITMAIAYVTITCLTSVTSVFAQAEWERGKIVGLRAGTCIREGPGLGYRAHTRVPENDWAVKVIDGPRVANGHTWWDTSRRAAGDPSGGTGWVTEDQTDKDCSNGVAPSQGTGPNTGQGSSTSQPKPNIFISLRIWWYQQSGLVKWMIAILALLLAPALWRIIGGVVIDFIGAAFLSLAIWITLDLTRSLWQGIWLSVAESIFGRDIPDLAFLLSVLPLASWVISLIRRSIRLQR